MPLHTVINYNGQLTGNDGIHKRWEHRLVDEYIKNIKPVGKIEVVEDSWSFSMKIVSSLGLAMLVNEQISFPVFCNDVQ